MMIIIFPGIGCAIYFFAVILPEMRNSQAARDAGQTVKDTLDPHRKLRAYSDDLEMSDTVENKLKLADELCRKGQPAEAIPFLIACLDGPFADNPDILARLANAYFDLDAFEDCVGTLEHLIEANPDHQNQDLHLLYARALEQNGDTSRALEEYIDVSAYFSGPEAKYRHAELLMALDRPEAARPLYKDILKGAKFAAPHVRKRHQEWIDAAERRLA